MAVTDVRTQIYLPRDLHRALRRVARQRRVSMAHLLRDAAEEAVRRTAPGPADPLADLIGAAATGPRDLSSEHDHYLYGLPKKRR